MFEEELICREVGITEVEFNLGRKRQLRTYKLRWQGLVAARLVASVVKGWRKRGEGAGGRKGRYIRPA